MYINPNKIPMAIIQHGIQNHPRGQWTEFQSISITDPQRRVDLLEALGRALNCWEPGRPGPKRIPRRDGDKRQARSRINHDIQMGIRPHPNEVRCKGCDHLGRDRRHEYDHHLGYGAEHHGHVEAVCSKCHHRREDARR